MMKILVLLLSLCAVQASITVVDTGQGFPSEPDKTFGLQLGEGYQYMGRMQILSANSQLCSVDSTVNQIVLPKDVPVALLAAKGGCTVEQKAVIASTIVHPPNLVSYLIVEDDKKRFEDEEEPSGIPSDYLLEAAEDSVVVTHPSSRHLKRHKHSNNDNIKVAILHVGQHAFATLQAIVQNESDAVKNSGGTKIILNSRVPHETAHKIFLWTLVSMLCLCCSCFCLAMFYHNGYFPQDEPAPPPRPVRRRLTVPQVRENFPSFHYHSESSQLQDLECSICLDEYLPGVRLRQLPCQHVFHSTCICRWLVERHANCPLCKIDLYEEEEEESSSSESFEEESAPPTQREPEAATTAAPTTTEPMLGTPTASSSSWWPFSTSVQSWFSSRSRRRATIEGGMLTELTEPLISNDIEQEAPETEQLTAQEPEQAPSTTQEDIENGIAEEQQETSASTQVEV